MDAVDGLIPRVVFMTGSQTFTASRHCYDEYCGKASHSYANFEADFTSLLKFQTRGGNPIGFTVFLAAQMPETSMSFLSRRDGRVV